MDCLIVWLFFLRPMGNKQPRGRARGKAPPKFWQAAGEWDSAKMTARDLEEVRRVFAMFDRDQDGFLSQSEAVGYLRELALVSGSMERYMRSELPPSVKAGTPEAVACFDAHLNEVFEELADGKPRRLALGKILLSGNAKYERMFFLASRLVPSSPPSPSSTSSFCNSSDEEGRQREEPRETTTRGCCEPSTRAGCGSACLRGPGTSAACALWSIPMRGRVWRCWTS